MAIVPLSYKDCPFRDTRFGKVDGDNASQEYCTRYAFTEKGAEQMALTPFVKFGGIPAVPICSKRCQHPEMQSVIAHLECGARLYNRAIELALNEQTLREQEAATANTAAVSPAPMPSQSEIPADVSARPGAAAR